MLRTMFGSHGQIDESYDIHASPNKKSSSPSLFGDRAHRLLEGLEDIEHSESVSGSDQSSEFREKKLTTKFQNKSLNKNVIVTQKGGGGRVHQRKRPTVNKDPETIEVSKDELEVTILNEDANLVELPIYNWNRDQGSSSIDKSPARDLTSEFIKAGED